MERSCGSAEQALAACAPEGGWAADEHEAALEYPAGIEETAIVQSDMDLEEVFTEGARGLGVPRP